MILTIITGIAYFPLAWACKKWEPIDCLPNGFVKYMAVILLASFLDYGLYYGLRLAENEISPEVHTQQKDSTTKILKEAVECNSNPSLPICKTPKLAQ
jgi:hypothetical protein